MPRILHYKLQRECDIHVVKMYLLRKRLNQLFDSNICWVEEQTNSCTTTEWHPRSLKFHVNSIPLIHRACIYVRCCLFQTQDWMNLSLVISSLVSSLLYHCRHVLDTYSVPTWTAILFKREHHDDAKIKKVKNKGSNASYSVFTNQSF